MRRENDWDFDQPAKKSGLLSLITLLLFGLFMAGCGGLVSYLIFAEAKDREAVETIAPQVMVNINDQIVETVEKIQDSVVSVINNQNPFSTFEDEGVSGSGVIYAIKGEEALIVTNHHVIEGASSIDILLANGDMVKAELIGYDQLTDLAVLGIPSAQVKTVAVFGDSDKVKVGESVIAVGNPLGVLANTVTAGIVSSSHRLLPIYFDEDNSPDWEMDMIQTDAAINFGNSGGALFNIKGEVIGINSAKIIEEGVESIGFSIPSNKVKEIVSELEINGKIRRPYLGIVPVGIAAVSEELREEIQLPKHVKEGTLIVNEPVGPAEKAGLKLNDVIVSIDGEKVNSGLTLRKALYKKKIGDEVEIVYYRDGKRMACTVVLEEAP